MSAQNLYGKLPVSPEVITVYIPPNPNSFIDSIFDPFTDSNNSDFLDSN